MNPKLNLSVNKVMEQFYSNRFLSNHTMSGGLSDGLAQTSWPRQSGPFLHKDCTGPDSPISMGQNAVFRYFIGPKRRGARKSGPKRRF